VISAFNRLCHLQLALRNPVLRRPDTAQFFHNIVILQYTSKTINYRDLADL